MATTVTRACHDCGQPTEISRYALDMTRQEGYRDKWLCWDCFMKRESTELGVPEPTVTLTVLRQAVNARCECGGRGPDDPGVCAACQIWHDVMGATMTACLELGRE